MVLQDGLEIRDLYAVAAEHAVQIRRLNYKRDSLEDIFLKAMENGNITGDVSAQVSNGNRIENGNGRTDDGSL